MHGYLNSLPRDWLACFHPIILRYDGNSYVVIPFLKADPYAQRYSQTVGTIWALTCSRCLSLPRKLIRAGWRTEFRQQCAVHAYVPCDAHVTFQLWLQTTCRAAFRQRLWIISCQSLFLGVALYRRPFTRTLGFVRCKFEAMSSTRPRLSLLEYATLGVIYVQSSRTWIARAINISSWQVSVLCAAFVLITSPFRSEPGHRDLTTQLVFAASKFRNRRLSARQLQ